MRYARQRLAWQLAQRGDSQERIDEAQLVLDPNVLTLGFARRFTEYKRTNLLLHDPERLVRILTHPERPVQLLVAGKAHPADENGKRLLQAWVNFVRRSELKGRVVFLADYDIDLAQELARGVDLWINTPRRPWEACGTSGMKVLVNGGLNLSVLDGWWDEAYEPRVGWAIGERSDDLGPEDDASDADGLYGFLESEIIPEFYRWDAQGIPRGWVARMRASMSRLAGDFRANRMLREYVEKMYLPVADLVAKRQEPTVAAEMAGWGRTIREHWSAVHFGNVQTERDGDAWVWTMQVYLGELPMESVRVELRSQDDAGTDVQIIPMEQHRSMSGAVNAYVYQCRMRGEADVRHFRPRVVPYHPLARVPMEAHQIKW